MITVVVPAYNASGTVRECIQSLTSQEHVPADYEVILVDDGSSDGTGELAEAAGARVIGHARKQGASAARNSGIRAARGEIICFTDADCVPMPDWISQIVQPLQDPAIVGCKGIYATGQREIVARFVQVEYEDKYDLLYPQPRIDFVDTYSAAFRRDILIANGGFDERIHFAEDRELAYRLASRGYEMVFQPSAVVYHRHSSTVREYFRKKFFIGYWVSQTLRRYPGQGIKDSHTPQVLKLQILLIGAFLLTLAAAVVGLSRLTGWILLVPLAILALFTATAIPFTIKAIAKDRVVGLASPLLLAVRALALGLGYARGMLRPLPGIGRDEDTIGGLNYIVKRLMDIASGSLGLTFLAILGPFIALALKLRGGGPVLERCERVGHRGRRFMTRRFRIPPGDDLQSARLNALLIRSALVRLPQAWNLLVGEMSLVGPEAETFENVARYQDWHRRRLAVKPGLIAPTGAGLAGLSLDERVRLELDYIKRYTLALDVSILGAHLRASLKGRPAAPSDKP